jgi:hypothetical protein
MLCTPEIVPQTKASDHVGGEQVGPKVAAILPIVESSRRLNVPVREYLAAVLPAWATPEAVEKRASCRFLRGSVFSAFFSLVRLHNPPELDNPACCAALSVHKVSPLTIVWCAIPC